MFSFDLTAFLTQNTAFYAGFCFGFVLGGFVAYLFFKSSFRLSVSLNNHLRQTLKDEHQRQKEKDSFFAQVLAEHIKQINDLQAKLSQRKGDN